MALVVPAYVDVSISKDMSHLKLLSKHRRASCSAILLPFNCRAMWEPARSVVSSFVTPCMPDVLLSVCWI